MSTLTRETKETRIQVGLDLGADGSEITTDDPFLSHMLVTLARYAGWGLAVQATGDLRHHLIEDVAIALGTVAGRDTPATCVRYGEAVVPMDEALVQVALDAGGRPHFEGELPSALYEHFFRSLTLNARWTVHVRVLRGRDRHHVVEAAFKALGLAARQAMADDGTVFSTKGAVERSWDGTLDEAPELGPLSWPDEEQGEGSGEGTDVEAGAEADAVPGEQRPDRSDGVGGTDAG